MKKIQRLTWHHIPAREFVDEEGDVVEAMIQAGEGWVQKKTPRRSEACQLWKAYLVAYTHNCMKDECLITKK